MHFLTNSLQASGHACLANFEQLLSAASHVTTGNASDETASLLLQLQRNRQLDDFFVRNLNQDPQEWAHEDKSFDAVLCCVSVQYLQQVTPP